MEIKRIRDVAVTTGVMCGTDGDISFIQGRGSYTKPSSGIPKTHLASAVQTSLGRADTALQTETDPVWSGVNNSTGAVDVFQNTTDIQIGKNATKIRIGKTGSSFTNGISIGENAYSKNDTTVAVGQSAYGIGAEATAIGSGSYASSTGTTAIGNGANAQGSYSASLGFAAHAYGSYSVAVGSLSTAQMSTSNAVAIGHNAKANANDAIQLGEGTNSTASSLQFRGTQIVNASGKIPAASVENDGAVTISGTETISGTKTFSNPIYLDTETPFVIGKNGKGGFRAVDSSNTQVGQMNISSGWYTDGRYGVQISALDGVENKHNQLRVSHNGVQYIQYNNATGTETVKNMTTVDDLETRIPYTLDENDAKTAITIGDRLSTATAFSETSQYTLGDVVTYGDKLFVCIVSPGTTIGPSSWASQASYWKQTRLGQNSFCQGHKNTSGHYAFANGYKVHADNNYTHAEGGFTVASGHYTHAEGRHTLATLNSSHSEGLFTEARAAASHASGVKASAVTRTSFVWQGTDLGDASIQDVSDVVAADIPMYYDHDPGTFNVNPVGGVNGFWIGEHRLSYYLGSGVKNKRATITSGSVSMSKEETIYVCSFTSAVGTLSITPPQLTSSEVFDFELWITLGASGSVTIPSTWVCVGTALDVTAGHTAYLACRVDNAGNVMYNQYYKA